MGSLAAALAIELAAVAIASIHREEAAPEEISMPSAPVDAVITELPPESTPPPEEEPPPPPPPPDEPTEFTIQEPTPPPGRRMPQRRSRDRKSRRIKARATAAWLTIRQRQDQLDQCAAPYLSLRSAAVQADRQRQIRHHI